MLNTLRGFIDFPFGESIFTSARSLKDVEGIDALVRSHAAVGLHLAAGWVRLEAQRHEDDE